MKLKVNFYKNMYFYLKTLFKRKIKKIFKKNKTLKIRVVFFVSLLVLIIVLNLITGFTVNYIKDNKIQKQTQSQYVKSNRITQEKTIIQSIYNFGVSSYPESSLVIQDDDDNFDISNRTSDVNATYLYSNNVSDFFDLKLTFILTFKPGTFISSNIVKVNIKDGLISFVTENKKDFSRNGYGNLNSSGFDSTFVNQLLSNGGQLFTEILQNYVNYDDSKTNENYNDLKPDLNNPKGWLNKNLTGGAYLYNYNKFYSFGLIRILWTTNLEHGSNQVGMTFYCLQSRINGTFYIPGLEF